MRQGHERAHGPYAHGNRWRVAIVGANGAKTWARDAEGASSFASYAEAEAFIRDFRQVTDNRTLDMLVTSYLDTRSDKERPTARFKLFAFLGLPDDDMLLASVNAAVARKLFNARCKAIVKGKPIAGATLLIELAYAKRCFDLGVANGWVRTNPFVDVRPSDSTPCPCNSGKKFGDCHGHMKRGKPKLRVNASRTLMAKLLEDDSLEATAVLTALMLGLRASAVVNRTVADLDDDGWLLWVRDDKTAAGDREIEVPSLLRERLMRITYEREPHERIFGPMTRHALHYHTVRLCKLAGVDRVTPHGLRGSAATKAVRMGGSLEDVAAAMGHADGGATLKRHYLGGGAEESARGRQMERLVPKKKQDGAEEIPDGPPYHPAGNAGCFQVPTDPNEEQIN